MSADAASRQAEVFVARNTAKDLKELARQMARVDNRRAASHYYQQGEDLAPVPPPRAEELKAELDRLMGDISRQLGEKAKPQAPPRSGFEHWADSPGMAAQERSAMRAARAHAPPPVKKATQRRRKTSWLNSRGSWTRASLPRVTPRWRVCSTSGNP